MILKSTRQGETKQYRAFVKQTERKSFFNAMYATFTV